MENFIIESKYLKLAGRYYHDTYEFQSESTLYSLPK